MVSMTLQFQTPRLLSQCADSLSLPVDPRRQSSQTREEWRLLVLVALFSAVGVAWVLSDFLAVVSVVRLTFDLTR